MSISNCRLTGCLLVYVEGVAVCHDYIPTTMLLQTHPTATLRSSPVGFCIKPPLTFRQSQAGFAANSCCLCTKGQLPLVARPRAFDPGAGCLCPRSRSLFTVSTVWKGSWMRRGAVRLPYSSYLPSQISSTIGSLLGLWVERGERCCSSLYDN